MTETERDMRLDFFRGLALFCIFVDHVPDNVVAYFTLQSVMFADAAEVFILISGYTAGMVYGRAMERQGFLLAGLSLGHRVWQLYVAHVFLFAIFMATVAYTVETLNKSLYAEEFLAADFLNEPGVAVVKALTLQFQPAYMDILPLYIVLLAAFLLVLAGFRYWPRTVLAVSLLVWLATQVDSRLALPAYPGPDRVWFFNPLGWQALFVLGAWLGWRSLRERVPGLDRPWLLRLAAGFALFAFVIRYKALWTFLSKGDLGLLRFASVLAVALLVARRTPPRAAFLLTRFRVALPNTARAIRGGRKLVIVAIGSSSTEGVGASDAAHAYPAVLAEELRRRWPRLTVTVINKGVSGEVISQAVARFEHDVLPHRPQLVIWQTGSHHALGAGDVETYARAIREGIGRLKAGRMDVVLMDPQFAPRVLARPLHARVVDAIGVAANETKVALFRRFAVMRHWISSGQYKMDDVVSRDGLHLNDVSYTCIARLLADSLAAAAAAVPADEAAAHEPGAAPGPATPP